MVCGAPTTLPGPKKTLTALAFQQIHSSCASSTIKGLVQAPRCKAQWKRSLELSGCKREFSTSGSEQSQALLSAWPGATTETICPFQFLFQLKLFGPKLGVQCWDYYHNTLGKQGSLPQIHCSLCNKTNPCVSSDSSYCSTAWEATHIRI